MKVTVGGERIGSGNNMKVSLDSYNRSSHDLGFTVRTTMAPGVLTPFMAEPMMPGTTFDIDLSALVFTLPTIGPMFGLYKIELHLFQIPVRLYQAALHMDMTEIGNNMQTILLPQVEMEANRIDPTLDPDNQQINPSSIWAHLGIRGLGQPTDDRETAVRRFNAIKYLGYWDVAKKFYANKQEEIGAVIHQSVYTSSVELTAARLWNPGQPGTDLILDITPPAATPYPLFTLQGGAPQNQGYLELTTAATITDGYINPADYLFYIQVNGGTPIEVTGDQIFVAWEAIVGTKTIKAKLPKGDYKEEEIGWGGIAVNGAALPIDPEDTEPQILTFPLTNIDDMRMAILQHSMSTPFVIDKNSPAPYGSSLDSAAVGSRTLYSKNYSLEGLALKCYQSDLFNNWLQTEWIDAINQNSSIDTTGNSFTMEAFLLGRKMFDMENRIAVSGGTYDDWLDAVYTHERKKAPESPIFVGGMQDYISFEEVVSNSASGEQPLGTLAGRGSLVGAKKGGSIVVRADEHCYLLGIASITPQLDYSQGNQWDSNLKTMDDWHKPGMDAIGWQDLITDQMAYWDTQLADDDEPNYKSAGKQPAWINYQTNVNRIRGAFAERDSQMFMVLNRRYSVAYTENENDELMPEIDDLTTYIDPTKFNHIFADTRRDAQNFWVQIGVKNTARIKMSANQIPNL